MVVTVARARSLGILETVRFLKRQKAVRCPGGPAAAYPRLKAEFAVLRPEGNIWKIPDGGSIGVWFPPQIDPEEGSGDE